jgi:beta-lactamase regulating signal transducer with metallopeptidase domain
MIAAWMLYSVAVSMLLFAGATAADHTARALGVPARFVWFGALVGGLGLSGAALIAGTRDRTDLALASVAAAPWITSRTLADPTGTALPAPLTAAPSITIFQRFLIIADGSVASLRTAAARIDVSRLERLNATLIVLWIAASVAAFASFIVSLVDLRRIERGLEPAVIDSHPVLVSSDIGPALLGILRARIVIPKWVLSLSDAEREIILTHEREHAQAFDPAVLYAAALTLVLQPWNVALWMTFARLRLALEVDCDRRVLAVTRDARQYGALLIQVYERTAPSLTPYIAFVERPSDLERRIQRIARRPRLLSLAGAAASVGALVLTTAAWSIAAPRRPTSQLVTSPVPAAQASQSVRTLSPVITMTAADDSLPFVTIPAAKGVPIATEPPMASVPQRTGGGPCALARRLNGTDRTPLSPRTADCTMDGDVVLVVLDSARVMVAFRDSADSQVPSAGYMIFAVKGGGLPTGLRWYSATGHAEFRGTDLLVASPGGNVPAIAITTGADNTSYPGALQFVIDGIDILRQPSITWDVIRQLPAAPRCTSVMPFDTLVVKVREMARRGSTSASEQPLIIVDGAVVSGGPTTRDCFVVGGRPIRLTLPD